MHMFSKGVVLLSVFFMGITVMLPKDTARDTTVKLQQFKLMLSMCSELEAKKKIPGKCELFGKIKFVDKFPDVKVKVVEHFPDIKVKVVDNFPDKSGKWKIVETFPDFKVKLVNNFPNYTIKFVDNFPGCK